MNLKRSYDEIVYLEVGINNRTGGYKVKFDFEKNLIYWFDSYMWNNNFMKHMNQDKVDILRNGLPKTGLLEWVNGYIDGNQDEYGTATANPSSWETVIIFSDGTKLTAGATQHFPNNWNALKLIIEKTTACNFRLH